MHTPRAFSSSVLSLYKYTCVRIWYNNIRIERVRKMSSPPKVHLRSFFYFLNFLFRESEESRIPLILAWERRMQVAGKGPERAGERSIKRTRRKSSRRVFPLRYPRLYIFSSQIFVFFSLFFQSFISVVATQQSRNLHTHLSFLSMFCSVCQDVSRPLQLPGNCSSILHVYFSTNSRTRDIRGCQPHFSDGSRENIHPKIK